ncbi:MAG: hypothetical protein HY791_26890 [Deltaproteobacteria bacterium]|nr:hypothetical protein [Deltaproteobacteria bacterium]
MDERRAKAFAEMRRRNNSADAARTPAERLADSETLLQIARAAERASPRSRSDETLEMMRRLRERDREPR